MTNSELALLSLLAERSRHGYEIESVIQERGMRQWTEIGFSSIYYILDKLEKQSLIEGALQRPAGRGPARKVYRITPKGKDACHAATLEALSTPGRCFPPILQGLANLPLLSAGEVYVALRKYRELLTERRIGMLQNRHAQHPLPYFVEAMFEYSLALIQAELEWLDHMIAVLEQPSEQPTKINSELSGGKNEPQV